MWGLFLATTMVVASPPAVALPSATSHVVVVCPRDLQAGLTDWKIVRQSQGWLVQVVEPTADAESTRSALQKIAKPGCSVLLVGDAVLPQIGPSQPARHTPTWYLPTPISDRFGSTDTTATDLPFADLDVDGMPDSPVGRIPADSAEGLQQVLARTLAAESNEHFGEWRRQVHLVAGVGGFGFLADTAIETAAGGLIQSMLPTSLQTSVTYASPNSPFFPGYDQFRQLARKRFSQDALAWVYIGHGQITELDRVPRREGLPILTATEADTLEKPQHAPPLALLLACYTGAFDARQDCLSEHLLMSPGGPVAVLSGARVTMPYGNSVLAAGLMDAWFHQRVHHVGDLLLVARQQLMDDENPRRPKLLDTLAKAISPTSDQLGDERREHAALYNLLGDPTMRLRHPANLELNLLDKTTPGAEIESEIIALQPGRLVTELCLPLSSVRAKKNTGSDSSSVDAKVLEFGDQDVCVVERCEQQITAGSCKVKLRVPADWEGFYVVRCFLESEKDYAIAAKSVRASKQ